MNTLKLQIGYYSSVINLLSTITFGVCFMGLFIVNPTFEWTTLSEYLEYCRTHDQTLKYIAQSSMIVFSITLITVIALIDDSTSKDKKFFSKLSLTFMTISATLISLGYFVQVTSVKWNFAKQTTSGLEQFIQFYPDSAILAIIMLGYTLFLGLSAISIIPVFSSSKKENWVKWGFAINGISCFLGLIGFVFQIIPLILFATNMGNGFGMIVLGIGLIRYFSKSSDLRGEE